MSHSDGLLAGWANLLGLKDCFFPPEIAMSDSMMLTEMI